MIDLSANRARLASDTTRSLASLAVVTVAALVGWLVYRPLAADNDWPTGGTSYFVGTLLVYYTIYFATYEAMTWWAFGGLDHAQLRDRVDHSTPRTPEQRWGALLAGAGARSWSLSAAALALGTVLAVALIGELRDNPFIVGASLAVVATSWLMVPFAFAVAYARLHVDEGGLRFPDDPDVVWSDYMYVAIQVSVTFASSDVSIVSTRMRRMVTAQSLIGFVFNTVIVALLVATLLTFAG